MKTRKLDVLNRTIRTIALAVVLILVGVCFLTFDVEKVQATDAEISLTSHKSGDFSYATFTDRNDEVKDCVGNHAPGEVDEYVFSGWYKDADCTKAVKSDSDVIDTVTTYYAKYVPEDILSTKVQVSTRDVNTADDVDTRNMRFVSTVDSVKYDAVGFAVKYEETEDSNEWKKYKNTGSIVYSRIETSEENSPDTYKFSPKVVDTKSNYFITATWKGPDNTSGLTNFDTNYYVRAYWVTLDGVTVYGPTRYVSVDDGLNKDIVNLPVKDNGATATWKKDETVSVTYGENGTASAKVGYHDGTYAHMKIDLDASTVNETDKTAVLDSVTQFTFGSKTALYRNLYNRYEGTGTADDTWYEFYKTTEDEFVIASSADLYGLASLVNSSTYFADQKVYIVADIEVNKGTAGSTNWSTSYEENGITKTGTDHTWTTIGTTTTNTPKAFQGVFDGQGHTISGINGTYGLFARSLNNTVIKNFQLKNSYFNAPANGSGSIVSIALGGTIENVYSDAFINSAKFWTGGLVGAQDQNDSAELTIRNCRYAGTLTTSKAAAGGILGKNTKGEAKITDCFFSGYINCSAAQMGGIVGSNAKKLTIEDCLFGGEININVSATSNYMIGGVVGQNEAGATMLEIKNCLNAGEFNHTGTDKPSGINRIVGTNKTENMTLTNVYYTIQEGWSATDNFYNNISGSTKTKAEYGTFLAIEESDLLGKRAFFNTTLFENNDSWALVTKDVNGADGTPVLKAFADEVPELPIVPSYANIDWYGGVASNYTICNPDNENEANVKALYGFSYLVGEGITFAGRPVNLGADVALNTGNVSDWDTTTGEGLDNWIPIGTKDAPFAGTFNGGMNSIQGLFINKDGNDGLTGLFGKTAEESIIQDLRLENGYVQTSTDYAGSVVADCGSTLKNVYSNIEVHGAANYIGGLIGQVNIVGTIDIQQCWFAGEVNITTTKHNIGGIIGAVAQGTVNMENSLNSGNVTSKGDSIGGLVGRTPVATVTLNMEYCLNSGNIEGRHNIGSVIGWKQNGTVNVTSVYGTKSSNATGTNSAQNQDNVALGGNSKALNSGSVVMLDIDEITGLNAVYNTEFTLCNTDAWVPTETTPALAVFTDGLVQPSHVDISWYDPADEDGYTICNTTGNDVANMKELYGLAYLANHGISFEGKTVTMLNDVTVNAGTVDTWKANGFSGLQPSWEPIGKKVAFNGTFDGNGKTISGLYGTTDSKYMGLFGQVGSNGSIQDVRLKNSYLESTVSSGDALIGSIAGYCQGNLDTVYSNTTIVSSRPRTGGLVGCYASLNNDEGMQIHNCWYDGSVLLMGDSATHAGGLIGYLDKGKVTIDNCLFLGNIVFDSLTKTASKSTGAFCGYINGTSATDLILQYCLNSGLISIQNSASGVKVNSAGRVFGQVLNNANISIEMKNGVYYTLEGTNSTVEYYQPTPKNAAIDETLTPVDRTDIEGNFAYYNTTLDFTETGKWALVVYDEENGIENGTPVLKSFASIIPELPINTTWYDGSTTEYTLTTASELRGFSVLASEGEDFAGETIKLGKDIDLNGGWTATQSPAMAVEWTPVGTESAPFAGSFDGQGYSISGIYVNNADTKYLGMFGVTASGTEVKDLQILNSYFGQQNPDGFAGSVAGELRGNMSGVYSNAIVKSGDKRTGGLVAWVNGDATHATQINITNCWFDGKVLDDDDDDGRYVGGVVATIKNGTCNMTNILFTGEINSNYNGDSAVFLGGIVAELYDAPSSDSVKLNMDSVVSAGTISGNHNHSVCNAVVGRVKTSIRNDGEENAYGVNSELLMKNVFATQDCYPTTHGVEGAKTGTQLTDSGSIDITSTATVSGNVIVTSGRDRLIGYGTQEAMNVDNTAVALNFANTWSMRRNDVPIPTCFAGVVKDDSVISTASLSETALAKEIGLDYWAENASIKDAIAYGAGNYLVTYSCTSDTQYTNYLEKLGETTGLNFKEYANNEGTDMYLDGVKNATFYKEYTEGNSSGEWVLNITYVAKDSKIYISINTDDNSLDDNLKSTTPSTSCDDDISLSMLEIVGEDAQGNVFGNSFVFQLPDGHFIVNDGGRMNSDSTKDDGTKLVAYLKELAGEGNDVIIDAWIITHFHGDHCGVMESFFAHKELRQDIYVEAVYACVPSLYALNYVNSDQQYGLFERAMRGIRTLTDTEGKVPKVFQMHMGQRYYFNGMTMDVLDTQEQHHCTTWGNDNVPDKFNTSSTNCLFTFKDANKTNQKVLIGGDATNVNMKYMMKAYGENNNTFANIDVFVAYHHGRNTTTEENLLDTTEANKNWADFLLKNTNNEDQLFDVVLFPYHKVYEMVYDWEAGGYIDDQGSGVYPYNIGEINQYYIDNAKNKTHYHYGNGTVKLTFGEELIVEP